MRHYFKTYIFKTLDILPNKLGYYIYHKLQYLSENKSLDLKIKSTESSYNTFNAICSELKIDVQNKSVIEIGSGWLPIIPYFFKYKNDTKNVYSFDINKHYQKKSISKLNSVFSQKYDCTIHPKENCKFNLPEGVNYYPLENIINTEIPDAEIVFSRFVLEHVTAEDIYEMHKKFKSSLKKGSYIVHIISPSDHRAYSDKNLSLQDFLKYNKEQWNAIQTKFDYHNRLRLPQYVAIFESLNLEIIHLTYDHIKSGTSQHDLFKKLKIHEDYKNYSEEQLTAGSINVVLKI